MLTHCISYSPDLSKDFANTSCILLSLYICILVGHWMCIICVLDFRLFLLNNSRQSCAFLIFSSYGTLNYSERSQNQNESICSNKLIMIIV